MSICSDWTAEVGLFTGGGDDGAQRSGQRSQAPQDPHDRPLLARRACRDTRRQLGLWHSECQKSIDRMQTPKRPQCMNQCCFNTRITVL